jgi:hypothetical protein
MGCTGCWLRPSLGKWAGQIGREAYSQIGEALGHGGSHAEAVAARPFSACRRRGLARGGPGARGRHA